MRVKPTAAVLLLALALPAGACGDSDETADDSDRTLIVDQEFAAQHVDPHGAAPDSVVNRARFDTLLTFEGDDLSAPVPQLAESYTANDAETEFTFDLRDDATFADGTPLTSADVVFSINRAIHLEGDGASLLEGVSVSAPDDDTVVLTSESPNPGIPYSVATDFLAIINSELAKENGASDAADAVEADTAANWLSSGDSVGVGSGPYKMVSFDTSSEIVLEKNDEYWGEEPGYDRIVLRNVPASRQALDVQRGTDELALSISATDAGPLRENDDLEVVLAEGRTDFLLFLNADPSVSAITADPKILEAVRYGLDYDGIAALAGPGGRQLAGLVPQTYPNALSEEDAVERDIQRAKDALAASGKANEPLILEYPDIAAVGVSFATVAQKIQASLAEIGLDVELAGGPPGEIISHYLDGQIAFGLVPDTISFPVDLQIGPLLPGSFKGTLVGWMAGADPELDELLAQVGTTSDPDEATDLWLDIQRRMNEVGPWIPLIAPQQAVVATDDIEGLHFNPIWTLDLRRLKPA